MRGWMLRLVALGCLADGPRASAEPLHITLSAGLGETTTDEYGFAFDTSGRLLLERVRGAATVEVGAAGGPLAFGADELPLWFSMSGGRTVISSDGVPASVASAGGARATVLGPSEEIPAVSPRMTVNVYEWGLLSVWVADGNGRLLGGGEVDIPTGGWWAIGLGSAVDNVAEPEAINSPVPVPSGVPEPAALLSAFVGLTAVLMLRGVRAKFANGNMLACTTSN